MVIKTAPKPQTSVRGNSQQTGPERTEVGIPITKPSRKGIGGRPRKADALMAVTLRLHPDVVAKFKAGGDDWRSRMAEALERAC